MHLLQSIHIQHSSQKSWALADGADKGITIKGSSPPLIQSKMDAYQPVVGTKP